MSQHHHVGGATGVGTRAVVVRGGPVLRTERHTVVDETDRTVTVDDGTRFAKTTGPVRDAPEADPAEPDGAHAPVRLHVDRDGTVKQIEGMTGGPPVTGGEQGTTDAADHAGRAHLLAPPRTPRGRTSGPNISRSSEHLTKVRTKGSIGAGHGIPCAG